MGHLWNKYEFGYGWPEDKGKFDRAQGKVRISHRAHKTASSRARKRVRGQLLEISGGCCWYCLQPIVGTAIVEHIVPKSRKGSDNIDNLALACVECDKRKGAHTALEFMYLNNVRIN